MALDFEETSSQYVDFGLDIPALNGKAAATITFWIILEELPGSGNNALFEMAVGPPPGTSTTSRVFVTIESTGSLRFGARSSDTGGSLTGQTAAGKISAGVLHFCAGVTDIAGDRIRIYIDGVEELDAAVAFPDPTFPATNSKNGAIMSDDLGGNNADGIMEDFRLYSRALSAEEILSMFNARGHDGITLGLQHRYPMNEGAPGVSATGAGTVKDIGPNGRDLTPVNTPIYSESQLAFRRRVA